MKFIKKTRFDEPFWFSGIYKITRYTNYNGSPCKPYYQCYLLPKHYGGWGNYVDRSRQYNKKLSFKQAKDLCAEHAKSYNPSPKEIDHAKECMANFIDN